MNLIQTLTKLQIAKRQLRKSRNFTSDMNGAVAMIDEAILELNQEIEKRRNK
jgi:hypothetical protein